MNQNEEAEKNLREISRQIYESGLRGEPAIEVFFQEVMEDDELLAEAIRISAESCLFAVQREERRELYRQAADFKPRYTEEQQIAIRNACSRFLSWPMMDGSFIKDASRTHLLEDAERYRKNAEGNLRNVRFLSLVAEGLEGDQKVSEIYTSEMLERLMKKAIRKEDKKPAMN